MAQLESVTLAVDAKPLRDALRDLFEAFEAAKPLPDHLRDRFDAIASSPSALFTETWSGGVMTISPTPDFEALLGATRAARRWQ